MRSLLEMHGVHEGTRFFFATFNNAKSTCSDQKTSIEIPEAYLRWTKKYTCKSFWAVVCILYSP